MTVKTKVKATTAAELLAAEEAKKAAPKAKAKAKRKPAKADKTNKMTVVKSKKQKAKVTIIKSNAPTISQFKKMVEGVTIAGRRTIELSFKLGEALIVKKKELGHGNFLPFLSKIGIADRTANKLMQAARAKDSHKVGQSFSTLIGDVKTADSADSDKSKETPEPKIEKPVAIDNLDDLNQATKSTLIMAIKALKKAVAGQLTADKKARLLTPEQFDAVVFNNVND